MQFEHPILLWSLALLVPALAVFFVWAWRTKRRLIGQFVQSRLLANLTVGVSAARQKWRMALTGLALVLLVLVLARPQWGFSWEEARQRGLDVIVAIDTSKSMLADDVAPNRLARARFAALDLKRLARTDRVGLVAFAGSAFLQCPLSIDDEAFRQSVNALDVNIIPQGGTALVEAISAARAAFKEKTENHKVLVLFTDGEDHDGHALAAAKSAADIGVRIFTIGVGTPNGEMLRTSDARGRSDFLRDDQGNAVKSRLNETLLKEIAQATGGFYLLVSGANTMDLLYERGLAPLPKSEFAARQVRRHHERYQWFLGVVIALLLAEMFLPDRRSVRRSEAIVNANNPGWRKAVAALLALAAGWPLVAGASPGQALRHFEAGRYEQAFREYERALDKKPKDPRLHYNAAGAAYRASRFDESLEHLQSTLDSPEVARDLALQAHAYTSLGNTHYKLGHEETDLQKRMHAWERALKSYEQSLQLQPADEDTRFNQEFVKKKIEELKEQMAKDQQKNQDQQGDEKNEQQKDSSKKDQQQQQKNSQQDQAKQDQQKNQEQDKSKQDQQQQNQQQKDAQDKQQQQQQAQQQKEDGEKQEAQRQQAGEENPEGQEGQAGQPRVLRMTPQQAMQLLDTLKSDEKTLLFKPPARTNRQDRVFKDW